MLATVTVKNYVNDEELFSLYRSKDPIIPPVGGVIEYDGYDYEVLKVKYRYLFQDDENVAIVTILTKRARDRF